jgi:hypothetical protein
MILIAERKLGGGHDTTTGAAAAGDATEDISR